jgi:succinate dehydrogenase / fumarate reductase cytochrome b subunit
MAGNLKAFQGADAFNQYAHHLRIFGEPILPEYGFLWAFRTFVLLAFVVHAWLAWDTSSTSWAARKSKYRKQANLNFDFASGLMRWGGVLILVFLVFHILHMTTGTLFEPLTGVPFDTNGWTGGIPDAYHNLVVGLSNPLVAGFYGLTMLAICLHLYHGVWSMFQTLGAHHPKYAGYRRPLAVFAAILIFLGFISIPVSVLAGIVTQ